MSNSWLINYLRQIETIIPAFCYKSIKQDEDKLGKDTVDLLILCSVEYYMTGSVAKTLEKIGGNRDDQDLIEKVLDDFIQLYTNQNLIILVCHRVEILRKFDGGDLAIERASLNQLSKLYDRINTKCPFKLFRVNTLKKVKVKAGISSLYRTVGTDVPEEIVAKNIDINCARTVLNRIRV